MKSDVFLHLRGLLEKYKLLLLVIAVGLLLILWPDSRGSPEAEQVTDTAELYDLRGMEKHVEEVLSQAYGVGRVSVVLTLKSDMETLFSESVSSGEKRQWEGGALSEYQKDSESQALLIAGASGEMPLVSGRLYPRYQGALIVCDGGEDPRVQLFIVNAVSALLDLSSDKISVIRMK